MRDDARYIHDRPHILGGCLGTSNHAIKLGSQVHVRSHVLRGFSGVLGGFRWPCDRGGQTFRLYGTQNAENYDVETDD